MTGSSKLRLVDACTAPSNKFNYDNNNTIINFWSIQSYFLLPTLKKKVDAPPAVRPHTTLALLTALPTPPRALRRSRGTRSVSVRHCRCNLTATTGAAAAAAAL